MNDREDAELSELIKSHAAYFRAPPSLAKRIAAALGSTADRRAARMAASPAPAWRRWFGWGVAFACGIVLGIGVVNIWPDGDVRHGDQVAAEVFSSHIRAQLSGRAIDMASSDRHTVKPWFNGKLDFSPPVADLAAEGYPLAGGRLDYLDRHTAAALVYRRRLHVIDVYVWPASATGTQSPRLRTRAGLTACSWAEAGMQYWAISDIPADEMKNFVQALRSRIQSS